MAEPGQRGTSGSAAPTMATNVIHEVFVSPRVVDREAFNDFSASLRRLIEQAGEQAAGLRAAGDAAATARQSLSDVLSKNQPRLEAAVKALAVLDQRALEGERVLSTAHEAAQRLDALARGIEGRIEQAQQQAETIARGRLEELEKRVQQAEARLARKTAEIDAWAADVLRRAEGRVDEVQRRIGTAVGEARPPAPAASPTLAADLAGVVARAEAATTAANQAGAKLQSALSEHAGQVDHLSDVAERLHESVQRSLTLAGSGEALLAAPKQEFQASMTAGIDSVRAMGEEQRRELAALLTRLEQQRTLVGGIIEQAGQRLDELSRLAGALAPWRAALEAGGELPEPLRHLAARVRAQVASDLTRLAGALGDS